MRCNTNIVEIFFIENYTRKRKKRWLNYKYAPESNESYLFLVISQLTNIDFDNLSSLRIAILNHLGTCFEAFDFHVDRSCINLGQPINIDKMTIEYSQLHILVKTRISRNLGRCFPCNRQFKFWQSIILTFIFYTMSCQHHFWNHFYDGFCRWK